MSNIQHITRGGKKHVLMPLSTYNKLMAALEEKEDARDLREAQATMNRVQAGQESLIPAEVVNAILDNDAHPVKAWRDYRGFTQQELADKAKISRAYLTQIETRKRTGTTKVLAKLAEALNTGIDALTD